MFSKNIQLSLVSFLILFPELVLIRFIGTEIRTFAYVPNLILLATFVGSVVGGLLPYFSYVFGIDAIIYPSLSFYMLVLFEKVVAKKLRFFVI